MTNVFLFSLAIAKVGILTGIAPGLAIAVFLELRGIRIVAIGFEKVRRVRVRPHEDGSRQVLGSNPRFVPSFFSDAPQVSAPAVSPEEIGTSVVGNQPAREVLKVAA